MRYFLATLLFLTTLHWSISLPSSGSLQRLARIVLPIGRQSSSLARSLEGPVNLARRMPEDVDFEDEDESIAKRQFDDYGHMRFGRNSPSFQDYGRNLKYAAAKYHPDDVKRVKENDWFIARYLLHQDMNFDKALKMLKQSLQFRHEMNINTLKKEDLPEYYFEIRAMQIYNVCKLNTPVVAIRCKVHEKDPEKTRLQQLYLLYWVEKAVRMNDWGDIAILFDCMDVGYKNLDLDMNRFMMTIFNQIYPWTMRIFIVYNMPWYMSAIWKIIKAWIPEKHLNRIVFVDKDSITEHIDKDQLPVCMGGTCTDQYESKVVEETSKGWF